MLSNVGLWGGALMLKYPRGSYIYICKYIIYSHLCKLGLGKFGQGGLGGGAVERHETKTRNHKKSHELSLLLSFVFFCFSSQFQL